MPSVQKRFGKRLRELRKKRGWTLIELGDHVGLNRNYLGDVERGERNISLQNIELIAKGFDITLSQFFSKL